MGALTILNTDSTNSDYHFGNNPTVSTEYNNSTNVCPTMEININEKETNEITKQNTHSQSNKQSIEIETIFVRSHKLIENLPTKNCTDPLSPTKTKNFSIREIVSMRHLNEYNRICKICNENWSKIALFPCLDTVCESCWTSTNKKIELDLILNKKIKSKRLIEKALKNIDCSVCKKPIKKFLQYMN